MLSAACAAHLETRPLDPKTGQPDLTKAALEGVVYYQPQYVQVTHSFTELVDKDGKRVDSTAGKKCKQVVQKEEIPIMPDYEKPYVIGQTGGFLNGNKFGVTLANGVLTGVNTESATKVPDLITAIGGAIGSLTQGISALDVKGTVVPDSMACNASPRITDFRRARLKEAL
jgi:hypothetical protein